MSDTVIKIENLSKKYLIQHQRHGRYNSLRDVIAGQFKRLWRPRRPDPGLPASEEFFALRDVSLEIKRGDRVGIIGRNGAGKSTLLKILSRITEPTSGKIEIAGRVASLLEVGTGFHPELTGRENVFLNGAILGMTRREIARKFDEIVAFAEVEKFLDTPVKHYSSGMYVRLAFAVAAHLEPEILIVDEVLAVGDASFQKKCLGKMNDASVKEGRTVLFVSHNMAAISSLSKKVVVLKDGQLAFEGDVGEGVDHYLAGVEHMEGFADLQSEKFNSRNQPRIFSKLLSIETLNESEERKSSFKMGDRLKIRVKIEILEDKKDFEAGIYIRDKMDSLLGIVLSAAEGFKDFKKGVHLFQIEVPQINLMPGDYKIAVWFLHQREVDDWCDALSINIVSNSFNGNYVDYDRFKHYSSIIQSNWKILS